MPTYFDVDEVFEDLEKVMRKFMESAFEFREMDLEQKEGLEQIDGPAREYTIDPRLEPEPIEPLEPWVRRRRPQPGRLEMEDGPVSEPLVDVFDRGNEVKVYIELPHADKNDVQLNVTEGGVEVKMKDFYRIIKVPADIDIAKATSKQKNRVLEVTIPKREPLSGKETHKVTIE